MEIRLENLGVKLLITVSKDILNLPLNYLEEGFQIIFQ